MVPFGLSLQRGEILSGIYDPLWCNARFDLSREKSPR